MMIQQSFSSNNFMDLLNNRAFKFAKEFDLLKNLQGFQYFCSSSEFIRLIFPLLQNEFYTSFKRDGKAQYYAIEQERSYPLTYNVQINQNHDIHAEGSFRIDLLQELPCMPTQNIFPDMMWKYQHFTNYIIYREMRNCIVAIYYKDEWNHEISWILGHLQKDEQEIYVEIPLKNESVQFLMKVYDLENTPINGPNFSLNHKLQYMQEDNFLWFQPIGSPSSYKNEAQAILSVSDCPFANFLLNPSSESNNVKETHFGQQVEQRKIQYFSDDRFRGNFDEDQQCAIDHAVDYKKKITLIKGPPGTGKTRTILGIIGILAELLKPNQEGKKGAILILAKSNSVVNDLIRKINENINNPNSLIYCFEQKPDFLKIIRTGRTEKCDKDIQPFSLEMKSQHEFFIIKFKKQFEENYNRYITPQLKEKLVQIGILKRKFDPLLKQENNCFSLQLLLDFIGNVNQKTRDKNILDPLGNFYFKLNELLKNNEADYKHIQQNFLNECHIIVTTLNSCTHECLESYFEGVEFRMCIVDEAPTALEASLLIPFVKYKNLQKIVLLGDVQQLNPITVAHESINYRYNRSMFERLSLRLKPEMFELRYQYRQLPNLAEITSVMFYSGKLINGKEQLQYPEYIKSKVNQNKNRLFFNTPEGTENQFETSRKNNIECKAIIDLTKYLLQNNTELNNKITIISAYRAQRDNLMNSMRNENLLGKVELDTVDSFQGKENAIIILSLVRSGNTTGFLSDKKRTNVALSRAKFCQFIFGTKNTMNLNKYNWKKVLHLMEKAKEIIDYNEEALKNPTFFQSLLKPIQLQI